MPSINDSDRAISIRLNASSRVAPCVMNLASLNRNAEALCNLNKYVNPLEYLVHLGDDTSKLNQDLAETYSGFLH